MYGESLTTTELTEASSTADILYIKAGYGERTAYAIEFSIDYVNNKDPLFSANDGAKYGLNVDLLKAFDFGIYVLPFAKVGLGAGNLDTQINEGSLNYGSFNLGLGMFIPYNEHLDFELGYNYRYLTYEKNKENGGASVNDYTPTSHINMVYLGINTRF
jgi:opacity protein-like surface antigen